MKAKTGDNRTKVRIVRERGESCLVEYIDSDRRLHRVSVPANKVMNEFVSDQELSQGIPYGYSWEDIDLKFDTGKFADLLHQNGLWTLDDILKNPQKVSEALHATIADNLSKVFETAKMEKKGVRS